MQQMKSILIDSVHMRKRKEKKCQSHVRKGRKLLVEYTHTDLKPFSFLDSRSLMCLGGVQAHLEKILNMQHAIHSSTRRTFLTPQVH